MPNNKSVHSPRRIAVSKRSPATPTGVTAIIDPYGRVAARLQLRDQSVPVGDIPQPFGNYIFCRVW
jgi:apolipoprotein N-acyltransferase